MWKIIKHVKDLKTDNLLTLIQIMLFFKIIKKF